MADQLKDLHVQVVPGYREFLKKEIAIREGAFLPTVNSIGGIEVRPLTPSLLLFLEASKNGFVVPCRFDSDLERCAHAMHFVWVVSTDYEKPRGVFHRLKVNRRRAKMIRALRKQNALGLFKEIRAYLDEAFYDGPKSGAAVTDYSAPASAAWIASLIDTISGASGYGWTEEKVLNMPFARLWQYHRLVLTRIFPGIYKPVNPSEVFLMKGGDNGLR